MAFNTYESSPDRGDIVELYEFTKGDAYWYYTSSEIQFVSDGKTYDSLPIVRTNFEGGADVDRTPITVTLPIQALVIQEFLLSPPTTPVSCIIKRAHRAEPDSPVTNYVGSIVNVKFDTLKAEVRIESKLTSLKRPVLRLKYQRNCPYSLYDSNCRANKEAYVVISTVTVTTSVEYNSPEAGDKPDGYYSGGIISYNTGTYMVNRFIIEHTGTTLFLNLPIPQIAEFAEVTIYPGCDRTLATCNEKFANEDNYGGQPFYPEKNPFSSNIY